MKSSDYLKLPYQIDLEPDETATGPCVVARCQELIGTIGQGQTPQEALDDLQDAMVDYIDVLLARGIEVPMPAQKIENDFEMVEFSLAGHPWLKNKAKSETMPVIEPHLLTA